MAIILLIEHQLHPNIFSPFTIYIWMVYQTHKLSAKFTNRRSFWHQSPLIIERSDGGTQRGKVDGELCPFSTFTRTKSNHHCTSSSPRSTPITPRGIRTYRTANTDDQGSDSNYDTNDYDPQDDPQDHLNARTFFWRPLEIKLNPLNWLGTDWNHTSQRDVDEQQR